jgi:hypothetical protein
VFVERFELRELLFPGGNYGPAGFVIAVDDDRALMGRQTGELFEVGLDSVQLLSTPGISQVGAAYQAPDGEIWLLGRAGQVYRGHLDRGFAPDQSRTSTVEATHVWADGSVGVNAALEIFVVSSRRRFERFDGNRWTLLDAESECPTSDLSCPVLADRFGQRVAWIRPGLAMALDVRPWRLLRYANGSVAEEHYDDPGAGAMATTVIRIEGLGTLIGDDYGDVRRREGEAWVPYPDSAFHSAASSRHIQVQAIAPYTDGFVYADGRGRISMYDPLVGFCEPFAEFEQSEEIKAIAPVGEHFFLLPDLRDRIAVLRRRY